MNPADIHRDGPTEDIEEHCMPEPEPENCPAFIDPANHLWGFDTRGGLRVCLFCGSRRIPQSPNSP